MSRTRASLVDIGWGAITARVLLVGMAAVVLIGAVALAGVAPLVAVLALPVVALVGFLVVRLWRVGVFAGPDGIVIGGLDGRTVVPWDEVAEAAVDAETFGFEPIPTVVLERRDGVSVPLSLLNERSLLMRGSPGGVQGLADRINDAIAGHRSA